jgi:hypothetical protein
MLVFLMLGMFAATFLTIYSDVRRHRAAEAEAADEASWQAMNEAEAEERRIAELELSEWSAQADAYDHGESGFHPGPRPSNFYSQF